MITAMYVVILVAFVGALSYSMMMTLRSFDQ